MTKRNLGRLLVALIAGLGSLVAVNSPANAGISQCTSGYFCVWTGTAYTGSFQRFSGSGWKTINFSTVRSAANMRSDRVYLHEKYGGSGSYGCFAPGARDSSLSGWQLRSSAVYLSPYEYC